MVRSDIYEHLGVTLLETVLAFGIGTALGLGCGLWLALSPLAAAIADPYIKALNSMPRVILAPIFAGHDHFHAHEASEDMYASIDKVVDKIERQIHSAKESLKTRKKGAERASEHLSTDVVKE